MGNHAMQMMMKVTFVLCAALIVVAAADEYAPAEGQLGERAGLVEGVSTSVAIEEYLKGMSKGNYEETVEKLKVCLRPLVDSHCMKGGVAQAVAKQTDNKKTGSSKKMDDLAAKAAAKITALEAKLSVSAKETAAVKEELAAAKLQAASKVSTVTAHLADIKKELEEEKAKVKSLRARAASSAQQVSQAAVKESSGELKSAKAEIAQLKAAQAAASKEEKTARAGLTKRLEKCVQDKASAKTQIEAANKEVKQLTTLVKTKSSSVSSTAQKHKKIISQLLSCTNKSKKLKIDYDEAVAGLKKVRGQILSLNKMITKRL